MEFIQTLEQLGVPGWIIAILASIIALSLIIEAVAKIFGKNLKIIKFLLKPITMLIAAHKEKKKLLADMHNALNNVNAAIPQLQKQHADAIATIEEFKQHYSKDNLTKRDKWMVDVNTTMHWARERAEVYDAALLQLKDVADVVKEQTAAVELNNKMTSELYKQGTRTQILDFSHKLVNARKADKPVIFSREEFRKIRKSYAAYEDFLRTFGGTNGEVDDAMRVVRDAEAGLLPNIEFLEDIRG